MALQINMRCCIIPFVRILAFSAYVCTFNMTVDRLAVLLHVKKVSFSNLGSHTDYSHLLSATVTITSVTKYYYYYISDNVLLLLHQ